MPFIPASGRLKQFLFALTAIFVLTACIENSPQAESMASEQHLYPDATQDPSFADWLASFRREALLAGISAATFDQAFAGVTPDPSIIQADQGQPEFTRPVWEYLDNALASQRVIRGRILLRRHLSTLGRIEHRYGVPPEILVAIWGLESNFGQTQGNKSVIRSLATLAHQGRRPGFAHDQLLAALKILQNGDVLPDRMIGSWAGAMGQTQFIPTTYHVHAVDFDGDGRRDIWDSSADALASSAHYLKSSGWRTGIPWGFEVKLPKPFDYAQADLHLQKPLSEWRRLGIRTQSTSAAPDEQASLLLPAGHDGPAFLVFRNFRAILKYNNSTSYALAIGLLSERLQGRGLIAADWPRNDPPLSRSERIALQERLATQGYDPGSADGIIGSNTRQAIRAFQQSRGLPADGYASQKLLEHLLKPDTPRTR
jgi:membrane-bound lytic murein transglycosylase B